MRDAGHDKQSGVVVDGIDDPVVADPYSVVVSTCKLGGAGWARISGESVDRAADPFPERTMQPVVRARRLPMKPDFVVAGWRARYLRTSAQDTVSSRSSRA